MSMIKDSNPTEEIPKEARCSERKKVEMPKFFL